MKQLFAAVLFFFTVNALAQTYKPALKINEGEKFTVTANTRGNMSQEAMGQTIDIPMDITTTSMLTVKKAAGGLYELSSNISRISLSMSMMGQDMNYDSDKAEDRNSDAGKELNALLNNATEFKVNSFGKTVDGSIKKQSHEKPAAGAGMFSGMLNLGDADGETSQAVNLFLSDAILKIGDSFSTNDSSADGKTKKSATYTLAEIKDGVAKFTITGADNVSAEMETQGMQMVTNTTTKSTGEMLVNVTTGLLIKKTLNLEVSGTIDVAGMSIPVSGSNTITITVAEAAK